MSDIDSTVIYVGKAKNLKKRLKSYFQKNLASIKTQQLVSQIHHIDLVLTTTENEALLLEINLIKKHRPRYNVLFRDDKSYPYLYLSSENKFPKLVIHRGRKSKIGDYFGPYPNSYAARDTLNLLQKVFKLRSCQDAFFNNRTRPCLQYQIARCTAPCVGHVAAEAYRRDVENTRLFLQGKSHGIIDELAAQMERASATLAFEEAIVLRNQISALRQIQQPQAIFHDANMQCDILGIALEAKRVSIAVLSVREGQVVGNYHYQLQLGVELSRENVLAEFLPQYYLDDQHARSIPEEIIISDDFADRSLVASVLTQAAKHKVLLKVNVRGIRAKWQLMATTNANDALQRHLAVQANLAERFEALAKLLDCPQPPKRIECFDISHTSGEATQAACVVFNDQGALKSDYRRYNISDITPGDDYAALRQALQRRYGKHQLPEKIPDLVVIDGGKGQLHIALEVLHACGLGQVIIVGVAKGATRKPGLETLFIHRDDTPIHLSEDSIALHLIQQIRDEAHRFAITGHRQRRQKKRQQSLLENIPGIGAKRRRSLIAQFGGWQGVQAATIAELATVTGISQTLAVAIHAALHQDYS